MMFKRAALVGIAITIALVLMLGRLAYVQLTPGLGVMPAGKTARPGLKRQAVAQRQRNLVLDTGRGDFTDRYGKAITGETYKALALFPVAPLTRSSAKLNKLAMLLETSPEQLERSWDGMTSAGFWRGGSGKEPHRLNPEQAEGIAALGLEGAVVVPYRSRYRNAFEAKHWVGFTGQHPEWLQNEHGEDLANGRLKLDDQVGGAGLEKSLDSILRGVGKSSVSYYMDGLNRPLQGLHIRFRQPGNGYYPLHVHTTVDLELQSKLEAYANRAGLAKGAVVVLDAANGDILAMLSRPILQPDNFRTSDGSEWENHALKAVEPGSIYKLITAAAALEYGVASTDEHFFCDGHYGKYGLSCWKRGGHGRLTLREGLAHSCNIVFATIAERLKADQLQRMADMLGVTGEIGWHSEKAFGPFERPLRLLEEEEAGRAFAGQYDGVQEDGGAMVQSGIGQRDVRLSPLAAANLIVTLLSEGRVMEPRLVSSISYANGQRMAELPMRHRIAKSGRRISPSTARFLLKGMEDVVSSGTGSRIKEGAWKVAGKTGTAETGGEGSGKVHQWFVGYGPVGKPRYAVAVLAADRPENSSHQATALFRNVMDLIAKHEASLGRT